MATADLLMPLAAAAALGLCLASARPVPSQHATLYVSPAGSDGWTGRLAEPDAAGTDGPFATLGHARDAIRLLRGGVEVQVRQGTYGQLRLGPEDSGTPDAPVTYRAYPGEEVRLSGGVAVPEYACRLVRDPDQLGRLDPAARGHVIAVDLRPLGIESPPELPDTYRGSPVVPELFCRDQRMTPARWPNEGWATIANIVDSGSRPRDGDMSGRPGIFQYSGDRPSQWDVAAGVWLQGYWCYDWYDEFIRVASIDPATRTITFAKPHLYSVMQGNPSPRRYRAINALRELDQPGEYYIDRAAMRLFFWPPEGKGPLRLVVSTLAEPVVSIEGASHVRVRGFTVETTLGDGIAVRGGTDCRIEACDVRNTREVGIRVEDGTKHRVEACDIHHTGTGGLMMSGGDRKTLTPAGHEAINNRIFRFSELQLTYAYGLVLGGVGNRAAHNAIYDAPHEAVTLSGNDHVFELNVIHDVCTETDDSGALHKGRDPSCRGNRIRSNYWYNVGSTMGHGTAAVYFDDGDGGDIVEGNVFLRCGDPGRGSFGTVFSHGGHQNLADGNLFIECKRALGSAPWDDARWLDALNGGQDCFWLDKLRVAVDITKPPYTTRYPELVGFLTPDPAVPRVNVARNNVLVRCGEVSSGNWQVDPAQNLIVDHDPGFADAAAGDYSLDPTSEVFSRLPGFRPIPFRRMGLVMSELRPTLE